MIKGERYNMTSATMTTKGGKFIGGVTKNGRIKIIDLSNYRFDRLPQIVRKDKNNNTLSARII